MYIKNIALHHFRNYEQEEVHFSNETNLIIGENAQGKTNLIEAVYLLSKGVSFKGAKDEEMIQTENEKAGLSGLIVKEDRRKLVEMQMERGKRKKIWINELPVEKMKSFKSQFDLVFFCPEHLNAIKNEPALRRNMFDAGIASLKQGYRQDISQYFKVLRMRNRLLKNQRFNRYFTEEITAITKQLSVLSFGIQANRKIYLSTILPDMKRIHEHLSGKRELLDVIYRSDYSDDLEDPKAFYQMQMDSLLKDCEQGYTGLGVHRDDYVFMINGSDAKTYGSQGQQRTVLLSYKLSEISMLRRAHLSNPILLLDDVFSELDAMRRSILFESIKGFQSIITTNDLRLFGPKLHVEGSIMKVVNGQVMRCS